MPSERYVLLGLAQVRSAWFREVSRWATAAALPIEFLKTMSVEEVRVRLRSGRGYSALLIDDSMAGLDRDLVDSAREVGCAVIVVDGGRSATLWADLGASALLPSDFGQGELLQVLGQVSTPVARSDDNLVEVAPAVPSAGGFRGRLIAVTGPGGAGRSTVAMAVAQGLAADPRHAELVCLADLALHADQAMLHDALDVVPGVVELIEAHRSGTPTVDSVRALTWRVQGRGYHLLLGLRRHRDWTSIRPRALEAAIDSLRRGFRMVVADTDDDLEGERHTGSLDVEERNAMARTVASAADLVVAVGSPGMHGVHGLLRVVRDLLDHGVSGARIVPVINRSPRSPRARAELARAFGELLAAGGTDLEVPSPIHLAERRRLDDLLRDGARLPDGWIAPVCAPVMALVERQVTAAHAPVVPEPVAVAPGTLGSWSEQDGDGDIAAGGVG
ncbi:MAG: AAA family ATPase [Actinomycetota bacterium]